jgi:GTP-binding protein
MTRRASPDIQAGEGATLTSPSRPVVALVGRPNVGKSALFNRMLGGRKALVEDIAGTTRDRLYGDVEWREREFRLVDTGGLLLDESPPYSALIRRQVEIAIEEAQVILFVVDAKEGLTAADLDVADVLRRTAKPVLLLANKAESGSRREAAVQFYELGLGEPIPVSAYHGQGVADVMDMVVEMAPASPAVEAAEAPAIAIVGRPNVGKSMLLNAILGEERVIVSDEPGTTRDSIDTPFRFQEQELLLLDTAGIRRRGRVQRGVEKHSVLRAERAVERADVALLLMDAGEGVAAQDTHIAGLIADAYVGLVLVVNKWDLIDPAPTFRKQFERVVRHRMRFAPWAPLCFISAKEGMGIDGLLAEALKVGEERRKRVSTGELNAVVQRVIGERGPPSVGGRKLKVLYCTQVQAAPPTFVFFVNDASLLHFSYRRYIENRLRRVFGFAGTPLRLVFKGRGGR